MKIRCLHGYFIFEETQVGQVSDFMRYTGLDISADGRWFTFDDLVGAPNYSLIIKPFLIGKLPLPAIKSFEGHPWEVFEANKVVYNFALGQLMPILAVVGLCDLSEAGNRFVSSGLIQPGALTDKGKRVKDYTAWFSRTTQRFMYSEVKYV